MYYRPNGKDGNNSMTLNLITCTVTSAVQVGWTRADFMYSSQCNARVTVSVIMYDHIIAKQRAPCNAHTKELKTRKPHVARERNFGD